MSSRINRRSRNRLSENHACSTAKEKSIEIYGQQSIRSVVFLVDGRYVVSCGDERKVRRWRVEDGEEVGTPMDTESTVRNIAVSQDGKWIVSGTDSGWVMVWNAESHEKVTEFRGHRDWVRAVDVSPDGTRIASGSDDRTACVWSLSTGQRLRGPLKHDDWVVAAKFSPDGRLVATATWWRDSVRIYSQDGPLSFINFSIKVSSSENQSLTWASNSEQLFALSRDGKIYCLDPFTGTTLFRWLIHNSGNPTCIALASSGTFVAVSDNSSVSFWDVRTRKEIGKAVQGNHFIQSMMISPNHDLATGGGKTITLRSLCDIIPSPYLDNESWRMKIKEADPEGNSESTYMQDESPDEKVANLEKTVQELRRESVASQHAANQKQDDLNETIASLRADLRAQDESSESTIAKLTKVVQKLRTELTASQHETCRLAQILHVHEQKHQCELLYGKGQIIDSARLLLEIMDTLSEKVRDNKLLTDWLAEFTSQCITKLEKIGDDALNTEKDDEALAAYSTALSLGLSTPNTILAKWARRMLMRSPANQALNVATKFKLPRFDIYRAICDILEGEGCVTETLECFQHMQSELGKDTSNHNGRAQWEFGFQQRCAERLEQLGDAAMDSRSYNEAARHFSTVLSLNPADHMDILIKRSKALALMNSWEEALNDANEAIKLDPSSHRGYECRHMVLHGARRFAEAVESFHTMLLKLDESSDEQVHALRNQYVDATPAIRRIVGQTIRHMPRVLIDVTTGRLYDKKQQAEAFETLPIYTELVSSMTTELDHARVWSVVKEFYRYVMLSHTWEFDEPLLQKVERIPVYELGSSPENVKLQMFCLLVRSLGFRWAWSDTCCIDRANNVVLQESLVAMFTWYRGSSLTVVHLLGVSSVSQRPGGLRGSIWNTRAWTYQEYVAAETVQFYTEDWKLYLDLDMFNHKESSAIIFEMQQATGAFTQELAVLRPGLERVREKLCVASMRQTTLVEDIAYSLLGIFNAAIPVIYGEGNRAVGRLLEHILTGSGDVTILAWTGNAGDYNSCLPTDLTVYDQLMPPHVPQPIETVEMDNIVTILHSSLPDLSLVVMLYDYLKDLPSPSIAASRLRLPGIYFPITKLDQITELDFNSDLRVYCAATTTLGDVEIKTIADLSGVEDLLLVHPWISTLLDQDFSHRATAFDETTRALRLVARLRQPFGALLLAPQSRVQYRRVATDCLIMVQVREEASLTELIGGIRMIDIQ